MTDTQPAAREADAESVDCQFCGDTIACECGDCHCPEAAEAEPTSLLVARTTTPDAPFEADSTADWAAAVEAATGIRLVVDDGLPPWEAVYESATFTSRLLAYCQDETTARGAAEAWLREHCTDAAGLVWTPDPQMAVREWDQWWSLSRTHEDGTPLDTEIVVRRRAAAQEG
ncbi:hypothetical protein ABH930_000282 [Kitasatospora sp. GAS204A]|uniref:hypothetical protein n=1 Tax=unclassified Kitasatospora TaxID=2633591 RepID=UPI002475D18A|nr:hypothetical protein [Kitasatospora sp. GAS204B]MDH6116863.1 hypothetical protein [Kitasatospora sp. GAS204B]